MKKTDIQIKKDDIYEILIEDMSEDGSGIGHIEGMAVFVKDTVIGDRAEIKIIKVKKSYAYGRLMKLITESEYRVKPLCPVARQCGGCTIQHVDYQQQLELKKSKVFNCLKRIGGIEDPEAIFDTMLGMEDEEDRTHFRFRNKMQFPIGRDSSGKPVIGFYAGRTHYIIPVEDCFIGHKVNKYLIDALLGFIERYHISIYNEADGTGLLRHLITRIGFKTGELMVALVINGKDIKLKDKLISCMQDAVRVYNEENDEDKLVFRSFMLSINTENTNRILGDRSVCIYGQDYIEDYIGNISFRISVESFFQVNPYQVGRLYGKALEYADLSGEEKVWDMYCGIGTISLFLAQKAKKVYGVEIVPQAIDDAIDNAKRNHMDNVSFFVGKAEDVVTDIYDQKKDGADAEIVVVDPPRKGCDEQLLQTLVKMNPERIVYVSCDPATLARDLKYLQEKGYHPKKLSMCDMFSNSNHVETVALIERNAR